MHGQLKFTYIKQYHTASYVCTYYTENSYVSRYFYSTFFIDSTYKTNQDQQSVQPPWYVEPYQPLLNLHPSLPVSYNTYAGGIAAHLKVGRGV